MDKEFPFRNATNFLLNAIEVKITNERKKNERKDKNAILKGNCFVE